MIKKIIIQADGNMYCAVFEDFINLQESISGWGESPMIALSNLLVARIVDLEKEV